MDSFVNKTPEKGTLVPLIIRIGRSGLRVCSFIIRVIEP